MSRPQSSNPGTTSELRQIFDTVWHDAVNDNPAISEKEFSFENFETLVVAQKERWEAEARKDELEQRKADHQEYYPIGSGNPYTSQKCIPFTYIDARIAALDGVIGEEQADD